MKKSTLPVLLIFLLVKITGASAQIKNDSLEYRIRPDSVRKGSLYLSINSFNFLRNYEFYNKFQDGYTLYGTELEPQLVYYPDPRLVVTGGIHLRKDFGSPGIHQVQPLFSIKYQEKGFTMITGSIEATIHHRFIEPLFDVERRITDPLEYGTQFIIDRSRVYIDAFVNWRRMIYKPSPAQEQILAGASSFIKIASGKQIELSLPLQLTVFHQGGQIDTINKPLQTLLNTAAGIRLTINTSGRVRELHTENFLVNFKELSPTRLQPFRSGSGIYLNAGAATRNSSFSASYWKGHQFISVMGMPVFQSRSQQINYAGYTEKSRELLFFRYAWQKPLTPHFRLDFRVEPVVDLTNSGKTDLYHSLFLVYRQEFSLVH